MKAVIVVTLSVVALLAAGCSEGVSTGPVNDRPEGSMSPSPEGHYYTLGGKISVIGEDSEEEWYAVDGVLEYEWVPAPGAQSPGMDLRLRTDVKLTGIAFPEMFGTVSRYTIDRVSIGKVEDLIVKRLPLEGNFGKYDLVLVLQMVDDQLSVQDKWLAVPRSGAVVANHD